MRLISSLNARQKSFPSILLTLNGLAFLLCSYISSFQCTLEIISNRFKVWKLSYPQYLLHPWHPVYFRVCFRKHWRAEIAWKGQMAFQYRGLHVSTRAAEKYWKTVWFCAEHVRLISYNRLMAYSITEWYKW